MQTYRIQRPGEVDLAFDGELLAETNSRQGEAERWSEARLYRTGTGRYVAEVVGRSVKRGEHDRVKVTVVDTAGELREALTRETPEGKRFLSNFVLDALTTAAENDPDVAAITVERI